MGVYHYAKNSIKRGCEVYSRSGIKNQ